MTEFEQLFEVKDNLKKSTVATAKVTDYFTFVTQSALCEKFNTLEKIQLKWGLGAQIITASLPYDDILKAELDTESLFRYRLRLGFVHLMAK